MSKTEELKVAEFFINRFNRHYNLNYTVHSNDNEQNHDSEVDVYANSLDNNELKIQVVTREGYFKRNFAQLHKTSDLTGDDVRSPGGSIKTEQWIKDAIKKKEGQYPERTKKSLILLVFGEIGSLLNNDYAKIIFSEFTASDFKGIYSVHLPAKQETSSHPHGGANYSN